MIIIDAKFNPGRALKNREELMVNGKLRTFRADIVQENFQNCPVAIFECKDEDYITLVYKPVVGIKRSADIDIDVYWSSVTGWMIR